MTFKGELYEFQAKCVEKMLKRRRVLVAHRMGLGKTVTAIAAVESLIDDGLVRSVLVICTASIQWQWKRRIDEFTDGALTLIIEGPQPDRVAQYRKVKRGDVEYVIMSYNQVVSDWDIVKLLHWDAIVCDEVAAIKNTGADRSRHIKRLKARYRFGLTGQPIENRPEDAFSIMEWIDRPFLGDAGEFDMRYIVRRDNGTVRFYKRLNEFRKKIQDVMDRRTRKDVADQMPALVETAEYVYFDAPGRKLYRKISRELVDVIVSTPRYSTFDLQAHYAGVNDGTAQGDIMARMLALRMLCDHPELIRISARLYNKTGGKHGSAYAVELMDQKLVDPVKASPKLHATLELIDRTLEEDDENKVVLFSFFKPMLAIIAKELKWGYEMFTGDLSARDRDAAIEHFGSDPNCRVFLSSDAGGVGVDLPMANYLISYDLPWSAGAFEQRKGRIDRISSKFPEVTMISMLMHNSIEERMLEMLNQKSAIAAAFLDGEGLDRGTFKLTLGTLADFLQERH